MQKTVLLFFASGFFSLSISSSLSLSPFFLHLFLSFPSLILQEQAFELSQKYKEESSLSNCHTWSRTMGGTETSVMSLAMSTSRLYSALLRTAFCEFSFIRVSSSRFTARFKKIQWFRVCLKSPCIILILIPHVSVKSQNLSSPVELQSNPETVHFEPCPKTTLMFLPNETFPVLYFRWICEGVFWV